jgi:hypothetical protein
MDKGRTRCAAGATSWDCQPRLSIAQAPPRAQLDQPSVDQAKNQLAPPVVSVVAVSSANGADECRRPLMPATLTRRVKSQ